MDFESIGRTWTGNIYHTFEAIFQEVDDFVTKDTVKYIENQVQIVGEGVKNVYTKVLHDFDPSMVFNKETETFASKKLNDASESQSRKVEDSGNLPEYNHHQNHINLSTPAEFPENPNYILNPDAAEKNLTEKLSVCIDFNCGENPASLTVISDSSIEKDIGCKEHMLMSDAKCSVEQKDNFGSVFHSKEQDGLLTVSLCVLRDVIANPLCTSQIDETMYKAIGGDLSSEKDGGDVTNFDRSVEMEVDIEDANMETVDLIDKEKVEEGSIMVDDWLIQDASFRPRRVKSYKRLIKDMFTSRKRLIKEYEQLAILYGEIDDAISSSLQQQEQSLFHHVKPSPICDSFDSEWELL